MSFIAKAVSFDDVLINPCPVINIYCVNYNLFSHLQTHTSNLFIMFSFFLKIIMSQMLGFWIDFNLRTRSFSFSFDSDSIDQSTDDSVLLQANITTDLVKDAQLQM